jgi:uncharacterized membrane protein YdjX (TVP38/TMEM64 family)
MSRTDSDHGKGRLLLPILALVSLVAALFLLPIDSWLHAAVEWVDGLGLWGPVALVGLYIIACVLFVPGSVLTLGAGAVFGVGTGTLAVFVGATLGACAAFLVGRHFARDWIAAKVAGNARFAAIDRAVSREGLKIVLLTRLSPVFPFNLLNYAYGLTGVRFRDYLIGCLGMLPGTLMFVYLGSTGADLAGAAAGTGEASDAWFKALGLVATIVVTLYVTRIAGRALNEAADLKAAEAAEAAGGKAS